MKMRQVIFIGSIVSGSIIYILMGYLILNYVSVLNVSPNEVLSIEHLKIYKEMAILFGTLSGVLLILQGITLGFIVIPDNLIKLIQQKIARL
jgi:hypothetical protein